MYEATHYQSHGVVSSCCVVVTECLQAVQSSMLGLGVALFGMGRRFLQQLERQTSARHDFYPARGTPTPQRD